MRPRAGASRRYPCPCTSSRMLLAFSVRSGAIALHSGEAFQARAASRSGNCTSTT